MKFYRFVRAAIRFCAEEATGTEFYPYEYDGYYPMIAAYREWRGLPTLEEQGAARWAAFYARQKAKAEAEAEAAPVSYNDALAEIRGRGNAS